MQAALSTSKVLTGLRLAAPPHNSTTPVPEVPSIVEAVVTP